jgi:NAD(P)-dependent dehydrogenase (short-subunit alcohol dehydrogenase family)
MTATSGTAATPRGTTTPSSTVKVWFITGTSRGFGREWAEAALERGDRVAATARNLSTLDSLIQKYGDAILPIELDVTDREGDFAAVQQAYDHFSRLDVVINNAGYGLFGAIEEASEEQARAQMETNYFGALWISQAALPLLRAQGSGHIIQVSSIGGIGAFPNIGMYHASKWALEGFSEAMAQEVAQFGIKVTIVEPSGFTTDWSGSSSRQADPIAAYDGVRDAMAARRAESTSGDPTATSAAILKIVDAQEPPLRILFGEMATILAPRIYDQRLKTWAAWDELSKAAGGN